MSVRTVLVLALLLLSAAPAVLAGHEKVRFEIEEPDRVAREAEGQDNHLTERPVDGPVRILDSFYHTWTPNPTTAALDRQLEDPDAWPGPFIIEQVYAYQPHRDTNGAVDDILFPGYWYFGAWFGDWYDKDGDGVLDYACRVGVPACLQRSENEFWPVDNVAMYGYIEPGAWYGAGSDGPKWDARSPDFRYSWQYTACFAGCGYWQSGQFGGVSYDGSLLSHVDALTVTDPMLAPSPRGLPFTPTASSLVDVDRYATVAPMEVEALYRAAIEPLLLAQERQIDDISANPLPFLPSAAGGTAGRALADYEHETEPGTTSSASAIGPDGYRESYRAWMDLIAYYDVTVPFVTFSAPDSGLGPAGASGASHLPGYITIDGYVGVWRDLDGDGYIGSPGASGDARNGGWVPDPNDYRANGGEFAGYGDVAVINATLRPTSASGWGPAGVWVEARFTSPPDVPGAGGASVLYLGSTPIPISLHRYGDSQAQYISDQQVFFPQGSAGIPFRFDSAPVLVTFTSGGASVNENVHDGDAVDSLLVPGP